MENPSGGTCPQGGECPNDDDDDDAYYRALAIQENANLDEEIW